MSMSIESLAKFMSERFKIKEARIVPEATLEELGFDSLSQVDLAVLLERKFNITIKDAQLAEMSNISDILAALGGSV